MKVVPLGELMPSRIPSINPGAFPDEQFTLWSIPSYDTGKPEQVFGRDVGSSKKTVQDGDVLLSKIVPHIRRAWKVSVSSGHRQIASSEWITFRHDAFLSDYIRHFLLTDQFHHQFMDTVAGVGGSLLRAQPKSVAKIGIPLPPLDEQRRIVSLLDRAAEIRRRADAARTRARDIIPALFLDMFGDPATNPKGWKPISFGEAIEWGPQNGLYRPSSEYGNGTRILRIDSFDDGRITNQGKLRRLRINADDAERFGLRKGDIVINRVNSPPQLGKSVLVPKLEEPTVFESNMMRLRLNASLLLPEVAGTMLQLPSMRQAATRNAKHAINQSSINQGDVKAIPAFLPPLALQTTFAEQAQRIEATARALDSAAGKAEAMAASLSAEVFA